MLPKVIIGISLVLTALAVSCSSPSPTTTPLPTFTPFPTATTTPTSTPRAEPTATPKPTLPPTPVLTPTPVATATPTPIPSAWSSLGITQDRISDEIRVTLYTDAINHDAPAIYDAPKLIVRCDSQEGVDVYVDWGGQYVAGREDELEVGIRFDSYPGLYEWWEESTNNQATFVRSPVTFIHRANQSEVVYIRMADFAGDSFIAEFRVAGLADAMTEYPALCQMPNIVVDETALDGIYFSVFPTEWKPLFGIGVPTWEIRCYDDEEDSIYFRIKTSGEVYGRFAIVPVDLSDISVQFDGEPLENVTWASFFAGIHILESPVQTFINRAKGSDAIVISGTIYSEESESEYEMRAGFDISELGELIASQPMCAA